MNWFKKTQEIILHRNPLVLSLYGYRDYWRSRAENGNHDIQSICMVLGPYRNLTTLTASVAFLHPNIQVLNHGAKRILPVRPVNFLRHHDASTLDNFIKTAIHISQGGQRGRYGGSITLSHAFRTNDIVVETYQNRYGQSLIKENINAIFWKDSMLVTNYLRQAVDLDQLFARNKKARFLLPIRFPLDCTVSNIKTKQTKFFLDLADSTPENVLDSILGEIRWFLDQQKKYPDRFFHFFENEIDEAKLQDLADFLNVDPLDGWIQDALTCYQLRPHHQHTPQLINHYKKVLPTVFADYPTIQQKLTALLEPV